MISGTIKHAIKTERVALMPNTGDSNGSQRHLTTFQQTYASAPLFCSNTCRPTSSPAALLDKTNWPSYARQGNISLSPSNPPKFGWQVHTPACVAHASQRPATFHQRSSMPSNPPRWPHKAPVTCPSWSGTNTKKGQTLRSDLEKAASYSPTTKCSTIGVNGLNFSVRNG